MSGQGIAFASRKSGKSRLASDAMRLRPHTARFKSSCRTENENGAGDNRLHFVSGRLDLNQRLQVPQTCTLNPCATARCCVLGRTSRKIAQQGSLVNKAFCPYSHLMSFLSEQHPIFPPLRLFSVGDPFSGNQILSAISATFRGTIQYQSL